MAQIDPPYRLDPLQNVVNVKWSEVSFGLGWEFITTFGNSGVLDCTIGANTTVSTTAFTVTLFSSPSAPGFVISGAPSVSGAITAAAGTYATLVFLPDSKTGNGPGSTPFTVVGLQCGTGTLADAGVITLTVPAITLTESETGNVYELAEWTASASAGISFSAVFRG